MIWLKILQTNLGFIRFWFLQLVLFDANLAHFKKAQDGGATAEFGRPSDDAQQLLQELFSLVEGFIGDD